MPVSVITMVVSFGTCKIPAWRSSSLLIGKKLCSFKNFKERGREKDSGSISAKRVEMVGVAIVDGLVNSESVIDMGKSGGSRDSLDMLLEYK